MRGMRTFWMCVLCLISGTGLGFFAMHRRLDLVGAAALIGGVIGPVLAAQAYKSVGSLKWTDTTKPDPMKGGNA